VPAVLPAPSDAEDRTDAFYRDHARAYRDDTVRIDMSPIYERFLSRLPANARILDAGSGSGRDTLAFLQRGYEVDAFDASPELSALSTALTGVPTKLLRFQEFRAPARYEGIWACASLLHVPRPDLPDALRRLIAALRPGGVLYMSFRHGSQERVSEDGRYFLDMDERRLREQLAAFPSVTIVDLWLSAGESEYSANGHWLNAVVRKEDAP